MGLYPLPYGHVAERYPHRRRGVLRHWRHVHQRTLTRYHAYMRRQHATPWPASWYIAALCVHSHEGAWNSNTGNGYYGGMQMDMSFQAAYGPEYLAAYGTADHWPVADQLHAAYRAWQSRGWTPWPNTAAMCGLLP